MNIAVAVRLMPKVGDELEIDESGTDIDRELVEMAINEFDDQALEEAVLIKEATGATVTAVGLRADGIDEALAGVSRGADRLVVAEAGEIDATTRARRRSRSRRRSASWRPTSCCGVQTPYDVFGQTAPYLARRSAGLRQASSSGSPSTMGPPASCRSTPVDGSPSWASSCRLSSACSPRAHHPGTWR